MNRRDFGKIIAAMAVEPWSAIVGPSTRRAEWLVAALHSARMGNDQAEEFFMVLHPQTWKMFLSVTARATWRDEWRRQRLALTGIVEESGMTWRGPQLGWMTQYVGQLGRLDGIRILTDVPTIDASEWRVCPHCLDEVPRASYHEHVQKDHGVTILDGVAFEP